MHNYLLITPGYPNKKNRYNNTFVHARIKNYKQRGLYIDIFSVDSSCISDYEYEGVKVMCGSIDKLLNVLKQYEYEKILVHFGFKYILKTIQKGAPETPIIIWVHGVEALGWYRRLFNINLSEIMSFFHYILFNIGQMLYLHRFIRKEGVKSHFVFVSNWMKNVLEFDTFSHGKIKNFSIIPNVIDEKIFSYQKKCVEDRLKILSIRPYASRKYGNDMMVGTILALAKKPFFNELHFTIYGEGKLFDKTVLPVQNFDNVEICKKFLSHDEIAYLHKQHGIILIPTRQDAQGVSMCEAMSSGLVPVTSFNTAIPEYVPEECGYLTHNITEMAIAIEEIYNNAEKFLQMSQKASAYIQSKCASDVVIEKEICLITGVIG